MEDNAIHQRAVDKAFAKISMLIIEKNQIHDDLRRGNTNGITMEELQLLYNGTKTELAVWNYIAELIEKNNNYDN